MAATEQHGSAREYPHNESVEAVADVVVHQAKVARYDILVNSAIFRVAYILLILVALFAPTYVQGLISSDGNLALGRVQTSELRILISYLLLGGVVSGIWMALKQANEQKVYTANRILSEEKARLSSEEWTDKYVHLSYRLFHQTLFARTVLKAEPVVWFATLLAASLNMLLVVR